MSITDRPLSPAEEAAKGHGFARPSRTDLPGPVRHPAPDASPSIVPTGVYGTFEIGRTDTTPTDRQAAAPTPEAERYRKLSVVIEAREWTGANAVLLLDWIGFHATQEGQILVIHTLEGDHEASLGDMIVKGVRGEFYPVKPDIFAATYEPASLSSHGQAAEPVAWRYEVEGSPLWHFDGDKPSKPHLRAEPLYAAPRITAAHGQGAGGTVPGIYMASKAIHGSRWLADRLDVD